MAWAGDNQGRVNRSIGRVYDVAGGGEKSVISGVVM